MSEEDETSSVLEKMEEETRNEEEKPVKQFTETKSQKNPNRVRAGHKLAAIGQKAKEEKMRRKVEDEMIKPKTWVSIGVVIGAIFVGGLWLGVPLLGKKEKPKESKKEVFVEEKPKPSNKYFG